MIYRTDYHIHSKFSDGKAEPEEYIENARISGMSEIGFSEHLNLFIPGQEWCMDPSRTGEYIKRIRSLAKKTEGLAVRTGFEVDYFPGREKETAAFLAPLSLDYVIGSVHYMGETTVDSSPDFYNGKDVDEIFRSYFELLFQAVESGLFDILGHCDLLRIYNHKPSFDPAYLYQELARRLSRHDVAFELNTNGRNRPLADFYPDRRFLRYFSEAGVPVCVNSDSHFPARIGQYFNEAYALLRDAGFREMCTFRSRDRYMVPADYSCLE